jgi:hypothetical protein
MMKNKQTKDTARADELADVNPLMEAYNAVPPLAEQPARFYWQEPWHDASADRAVQAAFED